MVCLGCCPRARLFTPGQHPGGQVPGLPSTATMLGAGDLADRLGSRRLFLGGLALFSAASTACALAPSATGLIAARAVLGLGAVGGRCPLVPAVEGRHVARVPSLAQPRRPEVPVGAGIAHDSSQVVPEVDGRGAPPEPVGVVDAVADEPRLEHERVGIIGSFSGSVYYFPSNWKK
jgi:hypothetical protein